MGDRERGPSSIVDATDAPTEGGPAVCRAPVRGASVEGGGQPFAAGVAAAVGVVDAVAADVPAAGVPAALSLRT